MAHHSKPPDMVRQFRLVWSCSGLAARFGYTTVSARRLLTTLPLTFIQAFPVE
jgi:hypothetical protein